MADKVILELVQSLKSIIDADPDNENEMNNAVPVHMSFEMSTMKIMRSYLDAHFNGRMNSKLNNTERFVGNLMLRKTI
ncbi:hypothetical protein TNCV_3375281 [Trichonephila clavipes]|nr:hypothetical protein TNCV_3375281 [Trichonephila clavipes]